MTNLLGLLSYLSYDHFRERPVTREVVARLEQQAAEAGLDAIVCLSPENVAYSAGFSVPSQALMRWRHAASVITSAGQEAMLCVDMEETTVRAARPDLEVRAWGEFTGNAMATLASLLADMGVGRGRVGLEFGYLSVADHASLSEHLPGADLVPVDQLLTSIRQIKTDAEVALLGRLARISDSAIQDAFRSVHAGSTEMELAAALTRGVYEHGAQQFKLMIVATGQRSQLPNVGPTSRKLEVGDVCRVEIFAVVDGYQAGVCRTAVVGSPSREADVIYGNLVECRQLVLEAMKPGVEARSVYDTFLAKFGELGLPPISFVGHGIGVDLHESPYLGPHCQASLAPGMVFGIEPLVYRTGFGFGMQVKDMVAVEDSGARLLSDVTDANRLFRIEV